MVLGSAAWSSPTSARMRRQPSACLSLFLLLPSAQMSVNTNPVLGVVIIARHGDRLGTELPYFLGRS